MSEQMLIDWLKANLKLASSECDGVTTVYLELNGEVISQITVSGWVSE
jgi:hypothetical protein